MSLEKAKELLGEKYDELVKAHGEKLHYYITPDEKSIYVFIPITFRVFSDTQKKIRKAIAETPDEVLSEDEANMQYLEQCLVYKPDQSFDTMQAGLVGKLINALFLASGFSDTPIEVEKL